MFVIPPEITGLLDRIQAALPENTPVYMVGGAVRDLLLGRNIHDLDFVLSGQVLKIARKVANSIGGAFYPLDAGRDTARIILNQPGSPRRILDFAALRAKDLDGDLRGRDFTINAMALRLGDQENLIDPLGGLGDLSARRLRACSASSIQEDPLRIIRGVRIAIAFNLQIAPDTRSQMRNYVDHLARISPERVRDELFRILDGPQVDTAIRVLDMFGALAMVLPELADLKGVKQSSPHIYDVWEHSLYATQQLSAVLQILGPGYSPDAAAHWAIGMVSVRLGRYRDQITQHLINELTPGRTVKSLLFLAALYHDIGKPRTHQVEESGRIRFFEHDLYGAQIARERAQKLRLSNDENDRLEDIIHYHLRPILLAQVGSGPSPRAIYRFFRSAGAAGVDVCLLSLADVLATYGPSIPREIWLRHLEVVRMLLEAYWEHREERVFPPALVNGNDLMLTFGLSPGPLIGQLLEAIREAQAEGVVTTREEALAVAHSLIK